MSAVHGPLATPTTAPRLRSRPVAGPAVHPTVRVLDSALLVAPVLYLVVDTLYSARGWDDPTAACLHLLGAACYGLAVLRLLAFGSATVQAVGAVVAMLGVVGNAGVAVNALGLASGGVDLFDAGGAANLWKVFGFFFPLSLAIGWVAARHLVPRWVLVVALAAVVAFPLGHVRNVGWLCVLDAVAFLVVFAVVFARRSGETAVTGPRTA